jgi:hypothetical protein
MQAYVDDGFDEVTHAGPVVGPPLGGSLVEDEVELGILVDARPIIIHTTKDYLSALSVLT